jgi:hypothetical protein
MLWHDNGFREHKFERKSKLMNKITNIHEVINDGTLKRFGLAYNSNRI